MVQQKVNLTQHFYIFIITLNMNYSKLLALNFYFKSNNLLKMTCYKFLSTQNHNSISFIQNRFIHQNEDTKQFGTSLTVDASTVTHHSKFHNEWWDPNGKMRALHAMNPLRVQFIRDGLMNMGYQTSHPSSPLKGLNILDIGCGGGILSESLARIGANVTGIDPSSELITAAKDHAVLDENTTNNLNYICTTLEDITKSNIEAYDAVIASEVVEHVNEPKLFFNKCVEVLKPEGSLFITTLNKTLNSWLGGIIIAEYLLKLAPLGTHDWNKFISPIQIQTELESCGCKTKLIHGMFYNPFKNEWCWSNSTSINYALHAVKK